MKVDKNIKKYIPYIYYTYVFLFIATGALLFAYSRSDKSTHSVRLFNVRSGSMEPKISKGDLIVTRKLDDYAPGTVITFRRKVKLPEGEVDTVTHRIIAKEFEGKAAIYATKGDANTVQDVHIVYAKDIIGRVYLDFPHLGEFLDFLRTSVGKWLFIFSPAIFIVSYELRNVIRTIRK